MGGRLASIHILDAAGTVVGPRGIEVNLQIADGFEHRPYLQVINAVDGGWRGDTFVLDQPTILQGSRPGFNRPSEFCPKISPTIGRKPGSSIEY